MAKASKQVDYKAAAAAKQAIVESEKLIVASVTVKAQQRPLTEVKTEALFGNYGDYQAGRFENLERNRLRWSAPNLFEFIPKSVRPFAFVRPNGQRVAPANFFTDGGSIPRLVGLFNGRLTPWGYGPAYLIHDWEFDLHHCNRTPKSFNAVRDTLMEALKTLMETGIVTKNVLDFDLIYAGVSSPIAKGLWNTMPPTCPIPPAIPE